MKRSVRLSALIAALVFASHPLGARVAYNTIGGTATVIGQGHVVRATVIIGCDTPGQEIRFTLTLTQAGVSGTGAGAAICIAAPIEYEVTVPAGGDRFASGLAQACATAENYQQGILVDSKQWCRAAGVILD